MCVYVCMGVRVCMCMCLCVCPASHVRSPCTMAAYGVCHLVSLCMVHAAGGGGGGGDDDDDDDDDDDTAAAPRITPAQHTCSTLKHSSVRVCLMHALL